jgi:hypothetical protein
VINPCFAYFRFHKNRPDDGHWFKTFLAPLLGGLGMAYVVYLLVQNASFAAGAAAGDPVFKVIPWVVGIVALAGLVFALVVKRFYPGPLRHHRPGRAGRARARAGASRPAPQVLIWESPGTTGGSAAGRGRGWIDSWPSTSS